MTEIAGGVYVELLDMKLMVSLSGQLIVIVMIAEKPLVQPMQLFYSSKKSKLRFFKVHQKNLNI